MNGRVVALLTTVALACAGAPVRAQEPRTIDIDAGRLSDRVPQIARQAGISVSVTSDTLWRAKIRSVHGRFTAGEALARMLEGTASRAVQLSPTSWRIEAHALPRPTPRRTPASTSPTAPLPAEEGTDGSAAIVVTASKLDQPYGDYAGVARILRGDDLGFGGEHGTESILTRLATVGSTHLGTGRNKLFIRGIADSSFTGPTQATVGQYLGDLRLSYNAPDPDLRLYDIDRVEILEGSQGTLYGAGSLGGVIRLVPNAPAPEGFSVDGSVGASVTQHGAPGGDIAATVNLPLGESGNAFRATAYGVSDGGYIDNPLRKTNDTNRTRTAGGRATLRLDPGDDWTIDIGGIYQSILIDDAQYADRNAPPLTRSSAVVQDAQAHYGMGLVVIGKDWGSIRFQSSNAYVNHALDERFDAAPGAATPEVFDQRNRTRMLVSESRLWRPVRNGFGWVIGLSAIDNRTVQRRAFEQSLQSMAATGVSNQVTEITAYGKLSIEPIRGLILSGGGRITHSRLGGSGEDVPTSFRLAGAAITAERSENEVLPSAEILGHLTSRLSLYARYEEGFRPGGLAIESNFVRRFRNDHVASWEIGARWGEPGDALSASLALAHADWRDIQADFIDGSGFPSTANIGNGRITSVSGSLSLMPVPNLRIELGGVYNHSRVTELSAELTRLVAAAAQPGVVVQPIPIGSTTMEMDFGAFGPAAHLAKIPNVADYAAQGTLDYRLAFDRAELRLGGWIKYVGPSRLGIGPVLGDEQGDYVDTGLAARLGNATRGVTLTLTNLLDAKGNRFALGTPFDTASGGFVTPQRPRTLRIALDYRL